MRVYCPYCELDPTYTSVDRKISRFGHFRRTSDKRWIQRFLCRRCRKSFSSATFDHCYRQNKRQLNTKVRELLCSALSQRRLARHLRLHRTTVARKLIFLGKMARFHLKKTNPLHSKVQVMEFDDIVTFEHTRCKPLSILLAVESGTRRILDFAVAEMPANGRLAKISQQKYGDRKDQRGRVRKELFQRLKPLMAEQGIIKSDESPHYPSDVKRFFPDCLHKTYKGRRAKDIGQGELKKGGFDPIFSLNHTAAMLRDNIKRLARRTWCTTKHKERLSDHIALYAFYHNHVLLK